MSFDDLLKLTAIEKQVRPYTAACIQAAPVAFNVTKTLVKVRDLTADASIKGAKLAVYPEAFLSAYPRGMDFGAVVGARSAQGREAFRLYHASSIDVPGPEVDVLSAVAREFSMHLVIGVIERDGGTLYCATLTFDDNGVLIGRRRKLMPTGSERLVWGFGDGSTLAVNSTALGRIGVVICWENYMPMLRAAMFAQRIQVYCAPTADGRATWLPSMQHIAMEGRCFVMSANQFCKRSDYPADYVSALPDDPDAIVSRGGSVIVDPLGQVLGGPLWDGEGIVTAEIDLAAITRALYDFDPIGHYSRPDVFTLTVDRRHKPPVKLE